MSQLYDPAARPTTRLLLAAWAALTAAALGFVLLLGTNSPTIDEWEFVPVLTGHEPAAGWPLARHNEHRFPLPRLLYLTLFQLTHDFRAGQALQVAALSGLSLWLMAVAARLRGRPSWPDLFFPVSLLHLGHWENFIQGYQVVFLLYAVLAAALVVTAARATPATAARSARTAGLLALLLALCGGSGVIVAVPAAVWVGWLAVTRRAAVPGLLAAVTLTYCGWAVAGYERPPNHPHVSEAANPAVTVLMIACEVLAVGLGIGVAAVWGWVAAGVVGLGGYTAGTLLAGLRSAADRPANVGLLAVVAGVAGVALAIGVGRAGFGDDMGLWSRYALLSWPALGVAYFAAVRRGGRWVPAGLCVAALLALPANVAVGLSSGSAVRAGLAAIEADARAGVPPERIVERFAGTMQAGQEQRGIVGIPMLQDAGVGAYAGKAPSVWDWWWLAAGLGLVGTALVAVRWARRAVERRELARAGELLHAGRDRYSARLLTAMAAGGTPRGLRWVGCELVGDPLLARDASGMLVGLVAVVVQFEPVEGSDMEANPAAREPRRATAVFTFERGDWHVTGRVLFNLTPEQAVKSFSTG